MKKLLLGALVALLPVTGFTATVFGFEAGAGNWTHAPSGSLTASVSGIGTEADLKDDLNLSKDTETYSFFALEHPVPLIPNIKFVKTNLTSAGTGNVTREFKFNGKTYSEGATVTTKLVLDQTDTILYYELLDNDIFSLDLGLTAKMIDGKATITGADDAAFSGTIPMLYAAVEIGLPVGLSLNADISTISAAGNEFTDFSAKLRYLSDFNLGVEAGVRTQKLVVDVDDVKTDINFSGTFIGVFFKF